jgi:lysyl-tRNA synthetase class 2
MASLEELRQVRLEKIKHLTAAGMNPFTSKVPRTHTNQTVKIDFTTLVAAAQPLSVAGRIMAIRGQGAILFVVLYDGTERLQTVFKKDVLSADLFTLFGQAIDIGDFISVTGTAFTTERGEPSLLATSWTIATKALAPLPDKWDGLQDPDERMRKRYLDILMNADVRNTLIKHSVFWASIRRFLNSEFFMEVETPTLEITTGGAEANPFKTHLNAYDTDVFLRISVGELWQKRLMAAGFPRTFEIGRLYRNEGASPEHLQEFTNVEFYASFMEYEEGMALTERLIKKVAEDVFGTMKFTTRGHSFDLSGTWPRIEYVETVKKMTGIDVLTATEAEMKAKLDALKVRYEGENRERLTDTLWKYCRKNIAGPAWLVNHPKLVSPLAKECPDKPGMTQRAQLILAGSEAANGFTELNDPQEQRERFMVQQHLLERGDKEAMMPDLEFVDMLEHGMPPTFGMGLGDRLFALLADKPVRETVYFPFVKPRIG